MLKVVGSLTALLGAGFVNAATEDEVRDALNSAFLDDEDDLKRVEDYLDFVSQFDKWNGIDIDDTDALRQRFLNWKQTDDTINSGTKSGDWHFGHTRFSDWSRTEKSGLVMDESFISKDSRSAIASQNCMQVTLSDSANDEVFAGVGVGVGVGGAKQASYNVDYRTYDVAGIQDQGECASCWDFSDVATMELNRNLDLGLKTTDDDADSTFVKLSEQYVLDCIDDGIGTCEGGYPIFTLMWVEETGGICTSDDYNDYTEEEATCDSSSCETSEASQYTQLFCLADESDSQVSYAASAFSVEFAFKVYSEFYNYESGVYSCDTTDEFIGWHAVTMVGVTDDYYIVKNSWSTEWGDEGYFMMSRDSFDDCAMSHFAFVTFNDVSDSLTESETASRMDIAKVQGLRTQSQSTKTLLRKENLSGIVTKHIKVHGKTNEIVLYVLGVVVLLSIVLMACGYFYRSVRKCKESRRIKAASSTSEESALLDGYVAL